MFSLTDCHSSWEAIHWNSPTSRSPMTDQNHFDIPILLAASASSSGASPTPPSSLEYNCLPLPSYIEQFQPLLVHISMRRIDPWWSAPGSFDQTLVGLRRFRSQSWYSNLKIGPLCIIPQAGYVRQSGETGRAGIYCLKITLGMILPSDAYTTHT